jgi:hypothetical protein
MWNALLTFVYFFRFPIIIFVMLLLWLFISFKSAVDATPATPKFESKQSECSRANYQLGLANIGDDQLKKDEAEKRYKEVCPDRNPVPTDK